MMVYRVVDCLPFGGTVADLDRFMAILHHARKEYPAASGTLVMGASLAPELADQARADGITLTTLDRLNAQLFDGRPYATQFSEALKSDSRYRPDVYIEPMIAVDESDLPQPALEVLDDWLVDPTWKQLTLLGDVGTGKTFLTHILFLKLAEAYLAEPASHPLPMLVDLRNADRQLSLEGLISTHLQQKGLERVTFSQFQHALSSGRIVLLLDGFDEMAARVTPQITTRNFNELVKCVQGNAKVLLTCRTHYFVDRSDEERVVYGTVRNYDSEAARELYWDLIARRGFRVAHLRPFEEAQIEEYVRRVRPRDAEVAIAKIREIYDLMELSQRPMLLEMIVSSIDRLEGNTVNAATLYQIFTDVWIQRDQWRDVLAPETKHSLVTSLALRLWTSGVEQLHHRELATHIAETVGAASDPRTLVEIDNELRTASFLVRNGSGEYRFAHKSYAEFFIVVDIVSSLEAGRLECLSVPRRLTREHLAFFVDMVKKVEQVDSALSAIVTSDYVANLSENALLCLFALRRAAATHVHVALPDHMKLTGAHLESVSLVGARMHGIDLRDAKLYGADLRDCDLTSSDLSYADFRNALMEDSDLTKARCISTDFTDVNLTNAQLDGADFAGAALMRTILIGTRSTQAPATNNEVDKWLPIVRAEVKHLFGDGDAADDIVQQVMLKILGLGGKRLSEITAPRLYVGRMVYSQMQFHFRARARKALEDDNGMQALERLASDEMSPLDRITSEEQSLRLDLALQDLSPTDSEILRLWAGGTSNEELASMYNVSESTMQSRRSRALERLRELFRKANERYL